MSLLQGIFLGLVQGLTEFLPISSSGHLVLFQKLFGISGGALKFDVAVHFASLLAVLWIFREDVLYMIKHPLSKLTKLVIVGTIPTVIMGLAFKDWFDKIFSSGTTLGFEFIFTGIALWYAESVRSKNKQLDRMTYADAAVVGVAQGIAILPAVSRSGLTLAGALARGLDKEFALKFSFLMSIPPILGAALLDLKDVIKPETAVAGVPALPLIAGMIAAAISGYFAIKFMLKIFSKASLKIFSCYVFILGFLIIAEQLFSGKIFGRLF